MSSAEFLARAIWFAVSVLGLMAVLQIVVFPTLVEVFRQRIFDLDGTEEVPLTAVLRIEPARVLDEDPIEPTFRVLLRSLEHQMQVVPHDAEREHQPAQSEANEPEDHEATRVVVEARFAVARPQVQVMDVGIHRTRR